jgi:hypothetical protein
LSRKDLTISDIQLCAIIERIGSVLLSWYGLKSSIQNHWGGRSCFTHLAIGSTRLLLTTLEIGEIKSKYRLIKGIEWDKQCPWDVCWEWSLKILKWFRNKFLTTMKSAMNCSIHLNSMQWTDLMSKRCSKPSMSSSLTSSWQSLISLNQITSIYVGSKAT